MDPSNNTPTGVPPQTPATFPPLEVDPNPARMGHRRAHSDNTFRFSFDEEDDFLFDIDNFDFSSFDIPSPHPQPQLLQQQQQQALPVAVGSTSSGALNIPGGGASGSHTHARSLSVGSELFDGLSFGERRVEGSGGGERRLSGPHRRASSMDGSSSSMFEVGHAMDGLKKAIPAEKLAELVLVDPKRAKRILANRQSAARSKEKKLKYASELEKTVQSLQTKRTALSTHVSTLKRDASDLTNENKALKLRLEALNQEAKLRKALNDTLRQEVQRLRISTGRVPPPHQQQFQMPSSSNQSVCEQPPQQFKPSFMDFDRRG